MNCLLSTHFRKYQLSCCDALTSIALGCSGAPYALRHYELSNQNTAADNKWGHRILCALEFVPLFGLLIGLIERIIAYAARSLPFEKTPNIPWRTRPVSWSTTDKKMLKNAHKALIEHQKKQEASVFPSPSQAIASLDLLNQQKQSPIHNTHGACGKKLSTSRIRVLRLF